MEQDHDLSPHSAATASRRCEYPVTWPVTWLHYVVFFTSTPSSKPFRFSITPVAICLSIFPFRRASY
eukprot:scaffold2773_cov410-Prasinococcus_capsulatus_cf.AAC.6